MFTFKFPVLKSSRLGWFRVDIDIRPKCSWWLHHGSHRFSWLRPLILICHGLHLRTRRQRPSSVQDPKYPQQQHHSKPDVYHFTSPYMSQKQSMAGMLAQMIATSTAGECFHSPKIIVQTMYRTGKPNNINRSSMSLLRCSLYKYITRFSEMSRTIFDFVFHHESS